MIMAYHDNGKHEEKITSEIEHAKDSENKK